jgi:hypothetical protein
VGDHHRGGADLNSPTIQGLGMVQDGFTRRWKATGEVEGVGWLEAWGSTLLEAMEALQAQMGQRVVELGEEDGHS